MADRTTQDFVPIKEVKDGVVVLRDGSLRGVLLASSLNFALKSEDEQLAIIAQFQTMLNSLEFPVQIFVQSRGFDIRPYTTLLEERYAAQTSDLMRIQIREYVEFIKSYLETHNVMSKSFFIVVSYNPSVIENRGGIRGMLDVLPGNFTGKKDTKNKIELFEEARSQLEQRMLVVQDGLSRTGIRVVPIGTEELTELFYKLFNPGELSKPITPDELIKRQDV